MTDIVANKHNLGEKKIHPLVELLQWAKYHNIKDIFPLDPDSINAKIDLHMDDKDITYIPEGIAVFKNLRILYAKGNKIKSLPKSLASLAKLEEVDFSHNELENIDVLHSIPGLKMINVSNNKLNVISPLIKNNANLKHFNIANNQIGGFPDEICYLKRLEVLNANNNQIKALNKTFNELSMLSSLYLDNNFLEQIDKEIYRLNKLKILSVRHNKISKVSGGIDMMHLLEIFFLTGNPLQELPHAIEELTKLKHLCLKNTNICENTLSLRIHKISSFDRR